VPSKPLLNILLCLCLAAAALPSAAIAQPREPERQDSAEDEQSVPVSRRQASEIVRQRYQGRILNIRLEDGYWRLRLDNGGVVFNLLVDARTGEIIVPEE